MDPVTFGDQWAALLAENYPESAAQIDRLEKLLIFKQKQLFKLVLYCAAHPELDMVRMYIEYNLVLDAVSLKPQSIKAEVSDEEAATLSMHQKAARTKRLRTRAWLVAVTARLIRSAPGSWMLDDVISQSGVSTATLYTHFPTRSDLAAAAYDFLISTKYV